MEPIGGYFSLELNNGCELHDKAIRLNAGRFALEFILKTRKYDKVFLPYYICDSVLEPIRRQNVEYEFYHINEHLEPVTKLQPKDNEAVLYVNYFGLKNKSAEAVGYAYPNTILDQTQAFYNKAFNRKNSQEIQCDIFNSCRKFFGVADGAYIYTDSPLSDDIPQDESFQRMTFLTKRIDRSPQEGFADFHENDNAFSTVGMRQMSKLTMRIMQSIDYEKVAQRRRANFRILHEALGYNNNIEITMEGNEVPMVYPYYVENGAYLRQHLISNKIYCACYWPNVLDWCQSGDLEYQLAENLVCLPIDQRYGEEEMKFVLETIHKSV